MAKPINEQVVVITGASSGIGRETALRLAGKGAKVVVSARRDEALDDLVQEIQSQGGEATSIPADVSSFSDVEALAQGALNTYGRIDTWVNNAGVLIVGEFENTDIDEARRLFDINFWGQLYGCKVAIPIMKQQGGGTIINISSVDARRALPMMSVYSASKAAVSSISESVRTELQGSGVEIVTIMPATIDTPLFQHALSKEGKMPRPAPPPIYPPAEVARAIERAATAPRREMYAGPSGMVLNFANTFMPGVLDKLLSRGYKAIELSEYPRSPEVSNLNEPMRDMPATATGGWRGRRYKMADLAGRVTLGLAALFLVRRLVK